MPSSSRKPCAYHGCPHRVPAGVRYCPEHARDQIRAKTEAYDDRRGTVTERGYGHAHRKRRAVWLAQHPWCVECERRGRLTPATVLDHIKPKSKGGADDESNYQSLCEPCHNRKRQAEAMQARGLDG